VVVAAGGVGLIVQVFGGLGEATVLDHLLGGSLLFGALFIATDPVSSPLTPKGKLIFGLGVGVLIMAIRLLSSYPEGVMFSILLMNAVVPLINRWTVPRPVGGPVPQQA
jgi:electron transport complex protein RnfD